MLFGLPTARGKIFVKWDYWASLHGMFWFQHKKGLGIINRLVSFEVFARFFLDQETYVCQWTRFN